MNPLPECAAYRAWKQAEVEADDAEAVLRLAFVKHIEGLGDPPSDALREQAMAARDREHQRMAAALRCRCSIPHA